MTVKCTSKYFKLLQTKGKAFIEISSWKLHGILLAYGVLATSLIVQFSLKFFILLWCYNCLNLLVLWWEKEQEWPRAHQHIGGPLTIPTQRRSPPWISLCKKNVPELSPNMVKELYTKRNINLIHILNKTWARLAQVSLDSFVVRRPMHPPDPKYCACGMPHSRPTMWSLPRR